MLPSPLKNAIYAEGVDDGRNNGSMLPNDVLGNEPTLHGISSNYPSAESRVATDLVNGSSLTRVKSHVSKPCS